MSSSADIFHEVPVIAHREEAQETSSVEFEKVVRSRRSVRVFTEERIPEEEMRRCLELAMLAPNSSNLQPWEFYWVRDESKKRLLAEFCLGQPAAATAQELIVCVARLDTWKRNRQLMLKQLEDLDYHAPESALTYYRKLVPLVYDQGPWYSLGPIKRICFPNSIALLANRCRDGPASKADMRVVGSQINSLGMREPHAFVAGLWLGQLSDRRNGRETNSEATATSTGGGGLHGRRGR